MSSRKLKYLVIEDAPDVCEGIEKRMLPFKKWVSAGACHTIRAAVEKINLERPSLLFLDWNLNGGSGYEVLSHIQGMNDYKPYVVFNTGFQSDHPEIPEKITNNYPVDKYLVKPIWDKLRDQLPTFVKEAENKLEEAAGKSRIIWITDQNKARVPLQIDKISCIVQNPVYPRKRDFYLVTRNEAITVPISWEKCYELLNDNLISYFVTKSRYNIVIREYIERFEKPFVRVRDFPAKLEVVKEKIKSFTEWLERDQIPSIT